jgi:hypothetical protein
MWTPSYLLETIWKQPRNETFKVSWNGTIVLINKNHKGCMLQMPQSQTMACNN